MSSASLDSQDDNGYTLMRVYSHPRSGTHFLASFVAQNFYPDLDLTVKPVQWGHWSNRKENKAGYPYLRLFANHFFPPENIDKTRKMLYIIRDPRAVAFSIWSTDNLLNQVQKKLSFSQFLSTKIDWVCTPAIKCDPVLNIAQHWNLHITKWINYSKRNDNVLVIRYNDLKLRPQLVYNQIFEKFLTNEDRLAKPAEDIKVVHERVGLLPNKGELDAWKSVFSKQDEKWFLSQLSPVTFPYFTDRE